MQTGKFLSNEIIILVATISLFYIISLCIKISAIPKTKGFSEKNAIYLTLTPLFFKVANFFLSNYTSTDFKIWKKNFVRNYPAIDLTGRLFLPDKPRTQLQNFRYIVRVLSTNVVVYKVVSRYLLLKAFVVLISMFLILYKTIQES